MVVEQSTLYSNNIKTALSCRKKVLARVKNGKSSDETAASQPLSPCMSLDEHGKTIVHELKRKPKYLSSEEINLLVAGYNNGITTYELAEQFGCNRVTVSSVLKKQGVIVSKAKGQKKLDTEDVVSMYGHKRTTAEIAEKYGVCASVVLCCLRKNGVAIRSRWDY